jgi:hypothetical protein
MKINLKGRTFALAALNLPNLLSENVTSNRVTFK